MNGAVRTTCPYCGVGCGVRVQPAAAGWSVAGDGDHPANRGRLCVKGSTLAETVVDDTRLRQPMMRPHKGAAHAPASWDDAMARVAEGFGRVIEAHGPDAVAFYVSGQLLTEDYYVANKLMKGFIGSANIDTNSRLCMSSAVAGYTRAFGEDVVPVAYSDVENADLVVLVGSNLAWCHPVLYQRLSRAREARPDLMVVNIDPRRTATCDIADMHLPLAPGSDVALFNGLLRYLHDNDCADQAFVDAHCRDSGAALDAVARGCDVASVARDCALPEDAVRAFFALFAERARTVTLFSQGVNQSSSGTDKVNAIINCHLLTGRIGRAGAGPFSITGQPNAMGGREVGGLANQLAAHLSLDDAAHRALVQRFWQSPAMAERPGLKAVDLFEAVHEGRVRAIWIMATNPLVSLPDADRVRAALERCDLVVVSEAVNDTDTLRCADIQLPAATWGERDGTVTNSERVISRQRPFRAPPDEARPDWWAICDLARRLGHGDAFDYADAHAIFDEHARLSAFGNGPDAEARRVFDIGGLAGLSRADYDALEPVQWPVPARPAPEPSRPYGDGRFSHPDGRARFVPTVPRAPANSPSAAYPMILNTGRVRDQWHTMTRTRLAPTLASHRPEPVVDMHPADALAVGVQAGRLARVSTPWGSLVVRATESGEMKRGEIFVPIHWNSQTASDARVGALVNPVVDPVSGEPEFKHTPARVTPFEAGWFGFAMARHAIPVNDVPWWVRVQGASFNRYELAGLEPPADCAQWARSLTGAPPDADWIDFADAAHGSYRAIWLVDDRVEACVFIAPRADLPARNWLAEQFGKQRVSGADRAALLAGEPPRGADTGPTVCSCFGVGRCTIVDAIESKGLTSPAQVTDLLKAGGNCGSCLPEIRGLISEAATVTE